MKNAIENITKISPIIELLGEERVEDLKNRICEVIIERVREDLDGWGEYICYPPDFSEIFSEAYNEVKKKLKKMYTDTALEIAKNAIAKLSNC